MGTYRARNKGRNWLESCRLPLGSLTIIGGTAGQLYCDGEQDRVSSKGRLINLSISITLLSRLFHATHKQPTNTLLE